MRFSTDKLSIPDNKITGYLLNPFHQVGKYKAKLFLRRGFNLDGKDLKDALFLHGASNEAIEIESDYGRKFVIEADFSCPDGSNIFLRSVWIIDDGKDFARLLTAYPV